MQLGNNGSAPSYGSGTGRALVAVEQKPIESRNLFLELSGRLSIGVLDQYIL